MLYKYMCTENSIINMWVMCTMCTEGISNNATMVNTCIPRDTIGSAGSHPYALRSTDGQPVSLFAGALCKHKLALGCSVDTAWRV